MRNLLWLTVLLWQAPSAFCNVESDTKADTTNARKVSDAEKWQLNQQHFGLEEKEKRLLAEQDNLNRQVDDLKSLVKQHCQEIEDAQVKLRKIKYDLITVQLQLIK